jgi:hypothetical protein
MTDHRRTKRAKRFLADFDRARNVQFYMCHKGLILPHAHAKGKNGIGKTKCRGMFGKGITGKEMIYSPAEPAFLIQIAALPLFTSK